MLAKKKNMRVGLSGDEGIKKASTKQTISPTNDHACLRSGK
jgi:hypothetical protein